MDEQQKFEDGLHPVQPGLEVVMQAPVDHTSTTQYHSHLIDPIATKRNTLLYAEKLDDTYDSPVEKQDPTASKIPRTICGMRKMTVILALALVLAVLVAVIAGGVAGGLKSKKSVNNSS
jgi:hypothetical protein